jgi:hypothetical protein
MLTSIGCKTKQNVTQSNSQNLPKKLSVENVLIHEGSGFTTGPCEPSIAINPVNPDEILAGSVLNNVYKSTDGGKTWSRDRLKSSWGVYGDPCLAADKNGYFYYLHLSNPDNKAYTSKKFLNAIVLQKSTDAGLSWSEGTGIGHNEPKQQDKEWLAIHPETGQLYVTWTEFDKYGSKNKKHKSRIRFATSTNFGDTFSEAITISDREGDAIDDDNTTEGAVPAVDKNGNIYVAWSVNEVIYFDKSRDGGKTWLDNDKFIAQQPEGWTQDIPGIGRCNGMPVTVVDNSDSSYSGTIYVNWTDQRNGKDNTDVFLIKSTDQGETWSPPIKVNQDHTKSHQFFTWMTVDDSTGYLYFVYYDRSKYKNTSTDVVLTISRDGGETFDSYTISKSSFTPTTLVFFGDYNHIDVVDGMVRPIWTRMDAGILSIWTALINFDK